MMSSAHLHMCNAIFSNHEFEQEGKTPFHFEFSFLNFSAITASFHMSFWQLVDNNYIFHMPGRQPPTPPKSRELNHPPNMSNSTMFKNMINIQIFENST